MLLEELSPGNGDDRRMVEDDCLKQELVIVEVAQLCRLAKNMGSMNPVSYRTAGAIRRI